MIYALACTPVAMPLTRLFTSINYVWFVRCLFVWFFDRIALILLFVLWFECTLSSAWFAIAVEDVSLWIAGLAKAHFQSPVVRLILCFLFQTNSVSHSPCFPPSKSVGPITLIEILVNWQSPKEGIKSWPRRKLIFAASWCVLYCVSDRNLIVYLTLFVLLFPNPPAPLH
jgi:hypothetical protein